MGVVFLYAAALLGGLGDDLRETEGLVRLDEGVNAFFSGYRTPSLIGTFTWITALGAGPAITGMAAVASALLWSQGRAGLLLPLWITVLGAQGTTWAGKYGRLPDARDKFEVVFWSAAIIGLICFSRIFPSLHYLSDVAAGVLVGVFWLLAGFTVAEMGKRMPA